MQRHDRGTLKRYLMSVDRHLAEPLRVVVIGGAAAALAYHARAVTSDIDTKDTVPTALEEAAAKARAETGLEIQVQPVAIYDGPYEFEDRLVELDLGFAKLKVEVPEKHDLALMKIVRGYEHDLEAIEQMHRYEPLALETLVERFRSEMKHVTKRGGELRLNLLALVARLFGDIAATRTEQKLSDWDTI